MTPAAFKQARQTLGLTQVQLAAVMGLHQTTVARIETGRLPIPQPVRRMLTAYLDGYRPEDWPEGKLTGDELALIAACDTPETLMRFVFERFQHRAKGLHREVARGAFHYTAMASEAESCAAECARMLEAIQTNRVATWGPRHDPTA